MATLGLVPLMQVLVQKWEPSEPFSAVQVAEVV
jgi:hypothetical protein